MRTYVVSLVTLALACGGVEEQEGEGLEPEPGVFSVLEVGPLALQVEATSLPGGVVDITEFGNTQLAVGSAGVFSNSGQGFVPVDSRPANAVAPLAAGSALIATPDALVFFDGQLQRSPLSDSFSAAIVDLAAAGRRLWLTAGAGPLYLVEDDRLRSFESIQGIRTVGASRASAVVSSDAQTGVLRPAGDDWVVRWSDDLAEMAVLADGRILGRARDDGRVWLEDDDGWKVVRLPGGDGPLVAQRLLQGLDDSVWILEGAIVHHYDASGWKSASLAAEIASAEFSAVEQGLIAWTNGRAWTLRLEVAPVRYDPDVAEFSANNCERCHREGGVAVSLETKARWEMLIDAAIRRVQAGEMPNDGTPLIGATVDTLVQWREDGLLE